MCFFKKKKQPTYVKLSDNAVSFFKEVIVPELHITSPIDTKKICEIEDWIYELENLKYDDNGNNVVLDKEMQLKLERAQILLAEFMGIWGGDYTIEDLDDLNRRLGLI